MTQESPPFLIISNQDSICKLLTDILKASPRNVPKCSLSLSKLPLSLCFPKHLWFFLKPTQDKICTFLTPKHQPYKLYTLSYSPLC